MNTNDSKTVMVVGAAGTIGSALCESLYNSGCNLIMCDIDGKRLSSVTATMVASRKIVSVGDCSDVVFVDDLIEKAKIKFGSIDAAVYGAYPKPAGWGISFDELTEGVLSNHLFSQLGAPIIFSKEILSYFASESKGSLVHISSIQGVSSPKFEHYLNTSMTSPIEYTAAKAGVISITKYLAKSLLGTGIRVNCVSPGGIFDNQPASFVKKYNKSCNSKGLLDAGDVVGAIEFLISKQSRFITGQNIIVDDGWTL